MDGMTRDCNDGGLDLTPVIIDMIKTLKGLFIDPFVDPFVP